MLKRHYMLGLLFVGVMGTAAANDQRDHHTHTAREASARFAEDRAICAEERNHGQRKKCMRTATAQRNSAMAQVRGQAQSTPSNQQQRSITCNDCGRVTSVDVNDQRGGSNALGVVAGGAAGALLGNQVGDGSGKTAATIAGAVGGAYLSKRLQENANSQKVWTVGVEYDNGRRASFTFDREPGVARGDRVRNAGQSISRM